MRLTKIGPAMAATGLLAMVFSLSGADLVGADGTETLGPPSVPIAAGSGVVAAGVGLEDVQPAVIDITVPADSTVEQVLVYWEGQNRTPSGDDTIVVDGTEVTGTLIGGPTLFFSGAYSSTYRADITTLNVISAGPNMIQVGGLSFDHVSNGAGLLVIYDDGIASEIAVVDGNDLAFINFAPSLDTTVAQTFNFAASPEARVGELSMFFSSVTGPASGGGLVRPTIIEVTVDGVTTQINNLLDSNDGDEWDTENLSVDIPAGATELTVQALSDDADGDGQDPLAASFAWNAASLALPLPPTVAPTTTLAPTTTVAAVIPPTTPTTTTIPPAVQPPTGILPETGSDNVVVTFGMAAAALVAGLLFLGLARRRPGTTN